MEGGSITKDRQGKVKQQPRTTHQLYSVFVFFRKLKSGLACGHAPPSCICLHQSLWGRATRCWDGVVQIDTSTKSRSLNCVEAMRQDRTTHSPGLFVRLRCAELANATQRSPRGPLNYPCANPSQKDPALSRHFSESWSI